MLEVKARAGVRLGSEYGLESHPVLSESSASAGGPPAPHPTTTLGPALTGESDPDIDHVTRSGGRATKPATGVPGSSAKPVRASVVQGCQTRNSQCQEP
ncbi:uncharacterized protein METZ01_LOCUS326607 [marine metagenome]|uniref:Uncharacterized protein n=1 Tax=marine metagenome TaxID=408172 RepID=A0A382PK42_9ZZZZ